MFNLHYRIERKTIGFVLAIIGVASIGGAGRDYPRLFTIHQTVEDAPGMRVYTPLEIAGRNIYIREGCYACHSQMIRTLRDDEVERYGPYFARRRIQIRSSNALGSKRRPVRTWRVSATSIRTNAREAPYNPREVVLESGDARTIPGSGGPNYGATTSARISRRSARSACPIPTT